MKTDQQTIIVGGGIAGLTAARFLDQARLPFTLLEARDRLGGRVRSIDAAGGSFDVGPSWFWPTTQPTFGRLVRQLGLDVFEQYDSGDIVFERSRKEPPDRFPSMPAAYKSMRVAGGISTVVTALASQLPKDRVALGIKATGVRLLHNGIELSAVNSSGEAQTHRGQRVIFTIPPRLVASNISFLPVVERTVINQWRDTPTWMAMHAKFVAIYDRPFWRENGLSGSARSMAGPLAEIHDATNADGQAALFGFLGLPSRERTLFSQSEIIATCVAQLARLFGDRASRPVASLYKDWSTDPFTATELDLVDDGHPVLASENWIVRGWDNRIVLAGSETSSQWPGYLAGAVDAAERAVESIAPTRKTITEIAPSRGAET